MPHQCVRCGKLYENAANEILKGCECGAKLFFFVKKDKIEKAEEVAVNLNEEQKQELERDVLDLIGKEAKEEDQPVILDLEAIRILQPGKYELDLVHLFKKEPLIFKLADGKYMIDLPATFNAMKKKK